MPTGLIFDLDGTLVTFTFDVKGTREAMIAELSGLGFDTGSLSSSSPTQAILDSVRGQIDSGFVADYSDVRKRLYAILDESELKSNPAAMVLPMARETLGYLKARSVRLVVYTNSGRVPALEVLRRSSLLDLFDFVLTRDDVDAMKPNPDGVRKAASLLSLPDKDVYYVGDSVMDVIAAKRAGLKVISVATGIYTADRLEDEGSDYVLNSLEELPAVLGL